MPKRSFSGAGIYRYGFNGKENDNDVKGLGNQQDYGARIYDPRLGRFLTVDPLLNSFPWNSVYSYAENDPINYVDLDGLEKAKPQPLKNVKIEIYAADKVFKERARNSDSKNQGQWHIIVAPDIQSASKKLNTYIGQKKINNLVISSHGFVGGVNVGTIGDGGSKNGSISNDEITLYNQRKNATDDERAKMAQFQSPSMTKDIEALFSVVNTVNDGGSIVLTGCFAGQKDEGTEFGKLLLNTKDATLYLNMDFSSYFPEFKRDKNTNIFNSTGIVNVVGNEGTLTVLKDYKLGWKKFIQDKASNGIAVSDGSESNEGSNIKIGVNSGQKPIQEIKQKKPAAPPKR